MRNQKTIENPLTGERILIEVEAFIVGHQMAYKTEVYTQAKGKRVWKPAVDTNSKEYRILSTPERIVFENNENSKLVSPAEILAAKLELWEKMKPE